jgi:hypothetical protein
MTDYNTELTALSQAFSNLATNLNSKLSTINQSIDGINTNVAALDLEVSNINTTLETAIYSDDIRNIVVITQSAYDDLVAAGQDRPDVFYSIVG